MKTAIIPQIKDIDVKTGGLKLSGFHLDSSVTQTFRRAAEIFDAPLEGEHPIVYVHSPLAPGEYRIIARRDKIELSSAGSQGLMYGLFTLSELDRINDGALKEFDAFDKPTLALRAVSDDISRGQISTLDNFFSIIRRLARYKYNTYQPYIEDVFQYACAPAWGRYSDPVSPEEWRAVIAYAESWNITVRPIVNLLGHFDKLFQIEEFQPLALRRKDGTPAPVMDPKKPEVRELISKLLRELVDCFGPGVIHCGGDEPVALTTVYGKQEAARLFIDHYTFISKELEKLGCTMMIYADFFAPPWGDYSVPVDLAKELPEGTEFVFWDYEAREAYPFVDALHKQELPLYISPGAWTWKRFSCDLHNCWENTQGLLRADRGRSRGMIMSSWADGGDSLRELAWPGLLVGANFSWSPASGYTYEECAALIHKSLYGFDAAQSELLDPIYHHDRVLRRTDEFEFAAELFRSPFEPVALKDWENISILQALLRKAEADLASLEPKRNQDTFNALRLTVARAAFTADKIAALPHEPVRTREQAVPYGEKAMALAERVPALKEFHRQLWFACNRLSEWDECAAKYDDLHDSLVSFARLTRLLRFFAKKK